MIQRSINITESGELEILEHHRKWFQAFKPGRYILELRKEKSKATHPMFGYLFGYVYPEIVKAAGGSANKYEIDYIHKQLKKRFGVEEIVSRPAFQGKQIVYSDVREPKSLSRYTVEEMQDYWMELQRVGAEVWGLVIHDPDPDWKEKWLEHQEKKKQITEKVIEAIDGEVVSQ